LVAGEDEMKVKLKELYIDSDIYPRERLAGETIDSYFEALKAGAVFPALTVQKISVKETVKIKDKDEERTVEKTIILDGRHRYEAYLKYNEGAVQEKYQPIEEVECVLWKEDILEKDKHLEELRIDAAVLNRKHGLRIGDSDMRFQTRRIVDANPSIDIKNLAGRFGVTYQTVYNYVSDILDRHKASRDSIICRLNLLGFTQESISKLLEEKGFREQSQPMVSGVLSNFQKLEKLIKTSYFNSGKSIEDISSYYNLDQTLVWGLILKGETDEDRFGYFNGNGNNKYKELKDKKDVKKPMIYNVWNFAQCDQRLGIVHPGRIPGQIAQNVLFYYTQRDDLVVDPMAGGGSTVDACLIMGRKCKAYDIKPVRNDIIAWDISKGFHEEAKGCSLIFLDPPYWRLQKENYSAESISKDSLDNWKGFMQKVAKDSYDTINKNGHFALVIEAFLDEKVTNEFLDLPFECVGWFKDAGFSEVQRISIPMPSQIKTALDVVRYRKKKVMLDLNRDLIIFKKV